MLAYGYTLTTVFCLGVRSLYGWNENMLGIQNNWGWGYMYIPTGMGQAGN